MTTERLASPRPLGWGTVLGLETMPWPIASSYELVDADDGARIAARHVPTGSVPTWWPGADERIGDQLARLATVDDATLLRWVQTHGLFGTREPGANLGVWMQPFERVSAIRAELAHYRACHDLLAAVRDQVPSRDVLRDLAARVAAPPYLGGVNVPLDLWRHLEVSATSPALREMRAQRESARAGTDVDLQALDALGRGIGVGLRRAVVIDAEVRADIDGLRLQARMTIFGPLAAGFVELYLALIPLRIEFRGKRRQSWRAVRICSLPGCGRPFDPRTHRSGWCSPQHRWRGAREGVPNRYPGG